VTLSYLYRKMTSHADEVSQLFFVTNFDDFDSDSKCILNLIFSSSSNREKLEIAQHFLLSSPPGQFNEVLTGKDSAPYHERQLPDLHIIVRGPQHGTNFQMFVNCYLRAS
jgi:hypothetical protein